MSVLVIAPHADDEVLGCGGMILKHTSITHVVVLAVGGVQHRHLAEEATLDERTWELQQASSVLNVTHQVLFPNYDMSLDRLPLREIVSKIDKVLDEDDYNEVYLPYASINHDHDITYRATLSALRMGARPHVPRLVAAYEYAMIAWQPTPIEGGRFYVDITDTLNDKLRALACYKSQLRCAPHPCSEEAVRTLAAMRGMEVGIHAAEMFYLLRMIRS
jgi:N-acetylglucosamine malate deacetylase 1